MKERVEILNRALAVLRSAVELRLQHHLSNNSHPLELANHVDAAPLADLSLLLPGRDYRFAEAMALMTALAPHLKPHFFDQVISQTLREAGDFPQLGGVRGQQFRGFLPTGETLLFLLAGEDLGQRFTWQQLFSADHFFAKEQMLQLEPPKPGEPLMSGKLVLAQETLDLITLGHISEPRLGIDFPAKRITTEMDWSDLVLNATTRRQIKELEAWLRHGDTLLYEWGMKRRVQPGYRALFHGPPGTGKTLTATLVGKHTGRSIFRIDLSLVVSKFIGETEKNLASIFDKAENKNWILFFDEADAVFGKRTGVRDAHDKYANQEVSYLLQRTEDFGGLVILASNLKSNIDDAFLRRFQSVIPFPKPGSEERLRIWKNILPQQVALSKEVHLPSICQKHELTGSNITNIVQYCALQSLARGDLMIRLEDIHTGIEREYQKAGKIL